MGTSKIEDRVGGEAGNARPGLSPARFPGTSAVFTNKVLAGKGGVGRGVGEPEFGELLP